MTDTRNSVEALVLAERIAALPTEERAILDLLVTRIEQGQHTYGPWRVNDGRDYRAEALAEVVDGLAYCGAELVRLATLDTSRKRKTEDD